MLFRHLKEIPLGGSTVIAVACFNKGYSHIAVDDNCWIVVNGDRMSPWIFAEAMEVLKTLPNKPSEYKPLADFRRTRQSARGG